jgi:hypothetical protein
MGLLGSFFGKDQAKDLAAAKGQSDEALAKGFNRAYGDYSNAAKGYDPYVQQGQEANALYSKMLMGDPQAISTLTGNPLFNGTLGADFLATQRAGNAAGWGAGKEALAGQRVFQQNTGSFLDRYRDQGQQGLQATGARSNALMGRGDLAYGHGATLAGNEINYGNAMAANRSTGINNLMGVAALGVNALNAGRQPTKVG